MRKKEIVKSLEICAKELARLRCRYYDESILDTRRYQILTKKIDLIIEHLGLEFYETERKESETAIRKLSKEKGR